MLAWRSCCPACRHIVRGPRERCDRHSLVPLSLQALAAVRELVTLLPGSNRDEAPRAPANDPVDRESPSLDTVVPEADIEASTGHAR